MFKEKGEQIYIQYTPQTKWLFSCCLTAAENDNLISFFESGVLFLADILLALLRYSLGGKYLSRL